MGVRLHHRSRSGSIRAAAPLGRRLPDGIVGLFLLAALSHPALAQKSPSPLELPQLTHLALEVEPDFEAERVAGTAILTLRNRSDAPLARVPLILHRLMRVTSVTDGDGRAVTFRQQVTSFADWERFQVNAIEVELAAPLAPDASTRLSVVYEGYLVGYTETGMQYVRDHVDRAFTILREDALAFPGVGVPSLETNRSAPRASFEFEVAVTVPADLVVATGGEEIAREERGDQVTWRYRSRGPAPYLIVAIAPYGIAQSGGLKAFHFPDDSAGARTMLTASRRAAERLGQILGPLDRSMALSIMEIPDGWGSQASLTGGIILEADAFRDPERRIELYHELTHLWNAVDLDTPSPRWNEGLAMFLQGRLAREIDGWDGEREAYERTAAGLLERCGGDEPCGRVPMRRYGAEQLTGYSYRVGRLMFAALYAALGEEAFDRALRTHFQAHQVSGTTTDDLVRAFVDEGGPAARQIFADWLDSTAWLDRLREASSAQEALERYRP